MATVYLGIQENLNREVAVKILSPEMFKDERYLQRFLNEARTACRLMHPSIVTIHDVGQVGNYCYIVMERLEDSLVEKVKFKPDSRLTPIEAFRIIRQVAGALDYAHKQGFIHRDIKPDNILFRKDGTAVLVDFGIARALGSQSHLTTTGMILGTPHYMSPEQCKGEDIDHQCDIYSLGAVLFETLTGQVPYKSDSAAGVLMKHVKDPIPQLPADLSKYQPIINKMMAKEKRDRVPSGAELIRLLDTFGPDSRAATIKGVKKEEWVFDHAARQGPKAPPPTTLPEDSAVITLRSPIPRRSIHDAHDLHPQRKSKAGLIVTLIAIPFILAAVYFLFFHNQSNLFTTPAAEQGQSQKQTQQAGQEQQNQQTDTPVVNETDENYKQHFVSAGQYLKNKEYDKALASVKKARDLKDTEEAKALENNIAQEVSLEKEKQYGKYFNLAGQALKRNNFKEAKKNIALAEKYKSTPGLEKLTQDIKVMEEKKAEEARKARRAAERKQRLQRQDDDAYRRAVSRNTIFAYEKYLEKYPGGRHAAEAKKKYEELKQVFLLEERIRDDTAYETAAAANTVPAYEEYLEKYPRGRHISEVRSKIVQLKTKLVKETKIKLDVQAIRFFESGTRARSMGQRDYAARFSREQTRYIYTEIAYNNKLYQVADFTSPVTIVYRGSAFTQELKGTIQQDKSARDGLYWRGMGWTEPGKWPTGTYTVTIYLEGERVRQSRFEVY
jgi:serine/threonine protein kinase